MRNKILIAISLAVVVSLVALVSYKLGSSKKLKHEQEITDQSMTLPDHDQDSDDDYNSMPDDDDEYDNEDDKELKITPDIILKKYKDLLKKHGGFKDKDFDFDEDEFFKDFDAGNPFDQMRKMHKHFEDMMKNSHDSFIIDFGNTNQGIDIEQNDTPDSIEVIVTIKNLDNQKINVKVEDGMISISGSRSNKADSKKNRFTFESTYSKTIPVPSDANPDSAVINPRGKDKIVITFKRN